MKKGLTEMVFILDRSGSMSGLEKDTIGGFNAMIKSRREKRGKPWCPRCFSTTRSSCSMTGWI